ncbi:MAG: MFS transporter [Anaerovoracaceae bacterium]
MYNLVYLGRFNVNNLIGNFAMELGMTVAQQNIITLSLFASYAIGSFFNGHFADKYGAKKVILLGVSVSIMVNFSVSLMENWIAIWIATVVNGFFQSMIWIGGISMLAHWWQEGERGKGIGIVNFFSGISHATSYLVPLLFLAVWPEMEWRLNFIFPICILMAFAYIFGMVAVERPEEKGLKPYAEKNHKQRKREDAFIKRKMKDKPSWGYFFKQKKFLWWCGIAILSSICRYGLLNWIPMYYAGEGQINILNDNFSNLTLPIGMAVGTLVITWVAGTKFFNNKGIIVTAMAALCGTLVLIFPMINNTQIVLVGIFFTGFALYGINGLLWLYAIDEGCRVLSGTAAGILNGFAYLGACLEGFILPLTLNVFEDVMAVFIVLEALCIGMVICGMIVSKKDTIVVPEVRE